MRAKIRTAAPWGLLIASFTVCAVFARTGLDVAALNAIGAWGVVAAGGWLLVRWVRRLAAGRRFRRKGGSVITRHDGPTTAELAAANALLAAEVADLRGQVAENRSRLDEHRGVFEMIGTGQDPRSRRSRMHVVPRRGA